MAADLLALMERLCGASFCVIGVFMIVGYSYLVCTAEGPGTINAGRKKK